MDNLIPIERIENRIYMVRGQKVMLDRDLAKLYGVKTFVLNQAVKRNIKRFPDDFMFLLSREEILRISQFVISSSEPNIAPLKFSKSVSVFTEQGVAMLSSVLRSERAVMVNIAIMRAFVKLNRILISHVEVSRKLKELEQGLWENKKDIQSVIAMIRKLTEIEEKPKKRFGFLADR